MPLFPGKSVVHQLDLITDLLGTPVMDTIVGIRNEKAKKYLMGMKKKHPVALTHKFPNVDPLALKLLQRMLAFDPKDRPSAEEALADPYFKGLAKIEREPSSQPISKFEFEFERRRVTKEDVRELIYREILEYHPQLLKDYLAGNGGTSFLYPSAIGHLKKQFAYLEENIGKNGPIIPPERKHVSLPRSTVNTCTVPPKPPPVIPSYSGQKITREVSSGAISRNMPKVTRPPPPPPARVAGVTEAKTVGGSIPIVADLNSKPMEGSPDTRTFSIHPQSISPHCMFRRNRENHRVETTTEPEQQSKQYIPEKPQPMNFDANNHPYYHSPSKATVFNNQMSIDAKLLQAQTQLVAAAHREAGAIQIGLT